MTKMPIGDLIVTMLGWFKTHVDKMYNTLDNKITTVNSTLDNKITTVNNNLSALVNIKTWRGEFCNPIITGCSIPAHITAKVYNNGKNADMQISMYFSNWQVPSGSENMFAIFNAQVIHNMCGCNAVIIAPENSTVFVFGSDGSPTTISSGTYNAEVDYFDGLLGRTGLTFYSESLGSFVIGRCYNANMSFGSWSAKSEVFKQGRYMLINVVGAVLS